MGVAGGARRSSFLCGVTDQLMARPQESSNRIAKVDLTLTRPLSFYIIRPSSGEPHMYGPLDMLPERL